MAYLDEITGAEAYNWNDEGIYQLEPSDHVQAGPGGVSNRQATELAKRTRNLHQRLAALVEGASTDFDTLAKIQAAIEALDFSDVNLDELRSELRGEVDENYDTMGKIVAYIDSLDYLPTFQGLSELTGNTIDWRGTPERFKELGTDTEVDASNFIPGKTIGMLASGNYQLTFTAKFKKIFGSSDFVPGALNYIQMKCVRNTTGNELIIYSIVQIVTA